MDQKSRQCQQGFEGDVEEFRQYLGSSRERERFRERRALICCLGRSQGQQFGHSPGKAQWQSVEDNWKALRTVQVTQEEGLMWGGGDGHGIEGRIRIERTVLSDHCSSGRIAQNKTTSTRETE